MNEAVHPFDRELASLGFAPAERGRRGVVHTLAFNRHLTFTVHDEGGASVLLSWAFGLGEHLEERGWRLSVTDTSAAELYPQRDVRVAREADAVRAEITRVLASLRLDLGDPGL
jgi:hypothetical protein